MGVTFDQGISPHCVTYLPGQTVTYLAGSNQLARRDARLSAHRVPAQEMVRHATQLTCQFIRALRHCLLYQTSWRAALPIFQRRLASYL